jgi:hypothetical protein
VSRQIHPKGRGWMEGQAALPRLEPKGLSKPLCPEGRDKLETWGLGRTVGKG